MIVSARRLVLTALSSSCVALACALSWSAPVQARIVHIPASPRSFGGEGSGPGQFKEPLGVAVNATTHDVYVVDNKNRRVEEFSESGKAFLGEFNGSGLLANEGKAAPTGAFSNPTLIAVDNSGNLADPSLGDVYVIDETQKVIDKFTASGEYVTQLTGTCEKAHESPPCAGSKFVPFGKLVGVAVSPSGEVWVKQANTGAIDNYSDALENQYLEVREDEFGESGNHGLAVDAAGDVFVNIGLAGVTKLDRSGQTLIHPFCGEVKNGSVTVVRVLGVAGDWRTGEAIVLNDNLNSESSLAACGLNGEPLDGFGFNDLRNGYGGGLAVDEGERNGTVYATAGSGNEVFVYDAITLPTVQLGSLSEQTPRSVTLNGTVDPEGSPVTSCRFEYAPVSEYEANAPNPYAKGTVVPCSPGSVGSGTSPVAVSARLEGLVPETRYDYRLVANNAGSVVGGPSATANRVFTAGPILGGEYVTGVSGEGVTLNAPIDPNGDDTSYYFQYGPTTAYGSAAPVSAPGVDLGSAPGVQQLSVHLQSGLVPNTLYHYRVVVLQGGEEYAEPDRTFTTQGLASGPVLPDNRVWELVSPADKKGALIDFFVDGSGDAIQAAADGSGITYLTVGPALGEEPQGKLNWSQTLSMRVADSPGHWASRDLTLPRRMPGGEEPVTSTEARNEYELFSSDLSLGIVEPPLHGTPLLGGASERTVYLRDDRNGTFIPLVNAGNVPSGTKFGGVNKFEKVAFVVASADLNHVVLASPYALTPEAVFESTYPADGQWNLYEWSDGQLQLVNILPEAEGGEPTRGLGAIVRMAGGSSAEGDPSKVIPSAISSDGKRIAWDLGVPYTVGYQGLFVRDMVEKRTLKVGSEAVFQWMSSDGSKLFFVECGDLYVFDFASDTRTDLTADHGSGHEVCAKVPSAGVQELVSDVSRDGSYIYFVAKGVLTGAPGGVDGGDNLYLLHDQAGTWSTTFIATLSPEDEKDWQKIEEGVLSDLSRVTSRVSPNGRFLAFMSNRPLTGYDNTDARSGHADEEVFLYHVQLSETGALEAGSLICASCDPTGARPLGAFDAAGKPLLVDRHEAWTEERSGVHAGSTDPWLAGSIPGWDAGFASGSRYQPRLLSDSGRLFFGSPDGLVPRATNGLEDVYEYEPVGAGGCKEGASSGSYVYSASAAGCVGLISPGTSGRESAFFDASETGDDVFFITAEKLVGSDYDNGYDVYDAHVCGAEGVPCVSEPVSPPRCGSEESCRGTPSAQPEIFGLPASATFSGKGNVAPAAKLVARSKSLTGTQKLARALKACRKKRDRRKRSVCERQARNRYLPRSKNSNRKGRR